MKNKKLIIYILIVALIVVVSSYRLDSYITRPGGAYELEPLVEVMGGDDDDEGSISLMTVSMLKATPALLLYSRFQDGYKILRSEQIRSPHESDEEYNVRQLKLMSDSQVNALKVAFEKAGKPYEINYNGVFVLNVLEGGAAAGLLEPGDRIISIDGNKFNSQEEFIDYLSEKSEGEKVELKYARGTREITDTIRLEPLPTDRERAGIGISFMENKKISTDPEVKIDSDEIGGPSAGLMFTLEIINQLMAADITKGYDVAGTGTIQEDGLVGQIGGIDQKVIAADEEGIDIFFAPELEAEETESNYDLAEKTAEKIGTEMKVVPVETVEDALDYLEQLQPK